MKHRTLRNACIAQFLSTSADYLGLIPAIAAERHAERLSPGNIKRTAASRPWMPSNAALVPSARCAD